MVLYPWSIAAVGFSDFGRVVVFHSSDMTLVGEHDIGD